MSVIDEYLATIDEPKRAALTQIRSAIKQVVPDAVDTIGYGMPVLKHNGKYLIGFAAFKNHVSIFPGAYPIEMMRDSLKDYKISKGTIQFTLDKPLPEDLIKEIVDLCMKATERRR